MTPRRYSQLLAGIIAAQVLVTGHLAVWNSPVIDEPAHFASGLYIWQTGRFHLYRVNPPLVKLVASLPAQLSGYRPTWSRVHDLHSERAEFAVGRELVEADAPRVLRLIMYGRVLCVGFAIIGTIYCGCWASRWAGPLSGLAAASLWAFNPFVLAWGSTFLPDVASASLGIAALYHYAVWIERPALNRAWVAGLTLGLALLTKLTLVVFLGLYPLLGLPVLLRRGPSRPWGQWLAIPLLGLYLLNLGYAFEGTGKPLGSLRFASQALGGAAAVDPLHFSHNSFANSWLGHLPLPFPENYVRGFDLQRVDFERGMLSYLAGVWQKPGWWYYYVVCLGLKLPLGLLALLAMLPVILQWRATASIWHSRVVLLLPALVMFVLVSSQTGINRYPRYVLPCLPAVVVMAALVVPRAINLAQSRARLVAVAWLAALASSLAQYPYPMAYFHELIGGPQYGSRYLADSNLDWGQDLYRVKHWLNGQPPAPTTFVTEMGFIRAAHLGIPSTLPPALPAEKKWRHLSPQRQQELGPRPGRYIASLAKVMMPDSHFGYLRNLTPVARIGPAMLVFELTTESANQLRERLGLPPWQSQQVSSTESAISEPI